MKPTTIACVTAALLVGGVLGYIEHDHDRKVQSCVFVADSISRYGDLDDVEELT